MGQNNGFRCRTNRKNENFKYETGFPYHDLPPPAPPNGRDDLWDLQFCRWWGWNWVRRRETEATPTSYDKRREKDLTPIYNDTRRDNETSPMCTGMESKPRPSKSCFPSKRSKEKVPLCELNRRKSPAPNGHCYSKRTCDVLSPPQTYFQTVNQARPLPHREQFKEMCKCLMGKKQKNCCGMANLYKTPSASAVAIDRFSYGVADRAVMPPQYRPLCISQNCKKKPKRQQISEDRCKAQSWCKDLEQEPENTVSEEIYSEPLGPHKRFSSTEESIEYLSVRLQHVKSDIKCPCRNHCAPCQEEVNGDSFVPTKEQVPEQKKAEVTNLEIQTSFNVPQGDKETQTCVDEVSFPCKQDYPYAEKVIKLKGKKHKTLCICVCCCGSCKPCNNGNDKLLSINAPEEHKKCAAAKNDPKGSVTEKNAPLPKDTGEDGFTDNLDFTNKTVAYPFFATSPNTKKLSKFGNPSKNYPWMQNTASETTTTTLNNLNTFKSPVTGKSYNLTTLDYENDKSLTLPDLIDISEDLSYLKTLENTTKSDDENRLLLDAVCDAILQEHQDKSLDFLTESSSKSPGRGFNDLRTWCDSRLDFGVKRDAYTDLSESLLKSFEDVGTQLSKTSNIPDIVHDPNVKLDNIDVMLSNIMDKIFTDSNADVAQAMVSRKNNAGPLTSASTEVEARQLKHPFKFKRTEEVFTRTGLLPSKASNSIKKPLKRGAQGSPKDDSVNKKMKQREVEEVTTPANTGNPNTGRAEEKIGSIFTKIEDMVKKSKLKSAEIQKVLNIVPSRPDTNNGVLETISLKENLEQSSLGNGFLSEKMLESDAESSKRSYKISSDAFNGDLCQYSNEDDQKSMKRSYDVFGDKFGYSPDETTSFFGNASPTIVEEELSNSKEESKKGESKKCKEKVSKLSIQSFLVCDEKSSGTQKMVNSGTSSKIEKKTFKKKKVCSKVSLIPIRKQSFSGGNVGKK